MKVDSENTQKQIPGISGPQSQSRKELFLKLMNERTPDYLKADPAPGEVHKEDDPGVECPRLVHLGTVTNKTPTVSNLLIEHPVYRKEMWRIIHSELNKDRPYTEIPPGTEIYLDPETHEVLWNQDGFRVPTERGPKTELSQRPFDTEDKTHGKPEKAPELIPLGMISRKDPTVSHLLRKRSGDTQAAYRIIHSEINQGKPFTRMLEGTRVFLNPDTLEIVWDREKTGQDAASIVRNEKRFLPEVPSKSSDPQDPFSENLLRSIEYFMGSSYEEIDCFELLVRGLNKMGIDYNGRGGLYDKLVKMAVERGLPKNAYLNGEGLVEASGTEVYSKSMFRIHNADVQANQIYREIEPLLNKGFILSFSTHTRGHTGIVSQKDRLWTYINSGTMDNNLGRSHDSKGVGEEVLAEEIKNWVRLAAESKESLRITLGRLNAQKLLGIET